LGVGTDLHTLHMSDELRAMQSLGLDAMGSIQAATRNGAAILGKLADFGTIETGKFADMVVVGRDPLVDVTALDAPQMVFKGGQRFDPAALLQAVGPVPLTLERATAGV